MVVLITQELNFHAHLLLQEQKSMLLIGNTSLRTYLSNNDKHCLFNLPMSHEADACNSECY